ncbi:MAG: hypothetical protein UX01_C0019G0011 [Candidatus Collierbacteria bacterium GW2011_GWB2_45_17]|uniref:Uncharacterized protein n=1 Tax=Candidatus Collierbacteria bacterium GW2011_GWB2_45_17 TaxID=1618388 RepID=A0A837ICX5_9BACT|nr:MAG: hypothetical protein UW48_C0020G0013 [Microgenomates group bacterium GW2011_GWC1_44_23]KKT94680.1 MAG: hypothetical protein UW96_C0017G0016 [Candidatus Collierbacteria bacterium GW2011_GWA1_45_15]KKT98872.1 MAG: hypothetical protein UX01_C0019G0011 [Candidatus Collierbacteria bacterium GW2011_GWB2_45_17]HBC44757.1 hypothetical protein [Candidatus Collierbacteria bacterium]
MIALGLGTRGIVYDRIAAVKYLKILILEVVMTQIPKISLALWKQLLKGAVEMPYFEAWQAHDVKALFDLGLIEFKRSKKPTPAISVVLSTKGSWLKSLMAWNNFWSNIWSNI